MAVWALGELLPASGVMGLKASRLPLENDPEVREEWEATA